MKTTAEVLASLPHGYRSSACFHGMHERCRLECKYCSAPCLCRCHEEAVAASKEPAVPVAAVAEGEPAKLELASAAEMDEAQVRWLVENYEFSFLLDYRKLSGRDELPHGKK